MANPVWPSTLPQDSFIGESFQRRVGFAQFTVDAGPAMRRRVFGNASTDVSRPMFFTATQMADFDDFYVNTLFEGSLEFDWIHPVTAATTTFRFSSYPRFAKLETSEGKMFQGVLDLELVATLEPFDP